MTGLRNVLILAGVIVLSMTATLSLDAGRTKGSLLSNFETVAILKVSSADAPNNDIA